MNAFAVVRVIPLVRTDGSAGLGPAAGLSLAGDRGTLALFHCLASGPGPLPAVGYVADLLRSARALAGAGSAAFRCLVLLGALSGALNLSWHKNIVTILALDVCDGSNTGGSLRIGLSWCA